MRIDLNADVGESFGVYQLGDDRALIRCVTSVNIACGFHAGDPGVMRRTVRLAMEAGAAIGAHPGFPDLQGFGRRELNMSPREIEDVVLYQVAALAGVVAAEGARLRHVKPHGALYNTAAKNSEIARAVIAGIAAFDRSLAIVGPPDSQLAVAAAGAGLRSAAEAFADRAYRPDGSLVPRHMPGAVIDEPAMVLERALEIVRRREVTATDGSVRSIHADTICVHGDTPNASIIAAQLRRGLAEAGIRVAALDELP
jgi:UPF0271 protein